MRSSVYNCVKRADVAKVGKAASGYKKMSNLNSVRRAARDAGRFLQGQMTKMVEGEASLRDYRDVGQAFTVFEDQHNIVVGIPPGHRLLAKAHQMHAIYQVTDVAHDLAVQSDDVEERFYRSLLQGLK